MMARSLRAGWRGMALAAVLMLVSAAALAAPGEVVYRAADLPNGQFMRDWLILGPFPNPGSGSGTHHVHDRQCVGMFTDYLAPVGGEAHARAVEGGVVAPSGAEPRTWFRHRAPHEPGMLQRNLTGGNVTHLRGDMVAFHRLLKPTDDMVAYASCVIQCDRDQSRLFGLGTDDGVRMWLNGREVWRYHETGFWPRSIELDDDYIRLHLRKGANRLLIKVDNGYGGWGFQIRPVSDGMARAWVLQNAADRLPLRFGFSGSTITGCFGVTRSAHDVGGLLPARVTVRTPDGRAVKRFTMVIGRTYTWPRSAFPQGAYLHADAELLVPGRAPYTTRAYVPTYDVKAVARRKLAKVITGTPHSRRAQSILDLIANIRRVDGRNNGFTDPYAYQRLEVGVDRLHAQLAALASPRATAFDGLWPVPKRVALRRGAECGIAAPWGLALPGSVPASACASLDAAWQKRFGSAPARAAAPGPGTVAVTVAGDPSSARPAASLQSALPKNREAFVLEIRPDRVVIAARSAAGAAYALDTLAQMLEQDGGVPCGRVVDWPTFPLRSVCELKGPYTEEFRRDIDLYARLRYNQVMVYGDYAGLADPAVAERMRKVFAYCRERFIEPVPSIETFGGGSIADAVDPDMVEGIYERRKPFTVGADGAVRIPELRILDTVTARPVVEDASGRKLVRDVDYVVESKAPPVIRFNGDAAQPGRAVRISYDWHNTRFFRFGTSCPSDPRRWPYIDAYIGRIFRELGGSAIHLGQDEGGYMNRDSRCLARHTTARKLMAEQFGRTYAIVRKYNPRARVYLWGDEFSPYMNAPWLGGKHSGEDLPKDVIVMDWAYSGRSYADLKLLDDSTRYFVQTAGVRIATASWFDPLNVVHLATMGHVFGPRYVGLVHTCWDDQFGPAPEGRELTAQAAWQGVTSLGEFPF